MGMELLRLCVHRHMLDMDCVCMDIYQAIESSGFKPVSDLSRQEITFLH